MQGKHKCQLRGYIKCHVYRGELVINKGETAKRGGKTFYITDTLNIHCLSFANIFTPGISHERNVEKIHMWCFI